MRYGIEEHVRIVEEVLPSPADRELVFWRTSNKVFWLGLSDTDPVTKDLRLFANLNLASTSFTLTGGQFYQAE